MTYYQAGWNDAQAGQFYAYSLPHGTLPNSETRVTYRAGWIANRALRGMENLPACILETHNGANRYYWIVAMDGVRPVYNVTNGTQPTTQAGYYDLTELVRLKGDWFE